MEFIDKSQIMRGIEQDSTADILEKGMNHKYYKREGVPGNYRYYYTEQEYKEAKGGEGRENKEDVDKNENTKKDYKVANKSYIDKVIDLLTTVNSKYSNPDKVTVDVTPKGNWNLYYDGKYTGTTIQRSLLPENVIRELQWEHHNND